MHDGGKTSTVVQGGDMGGKGDKLDVAEMRMYDGRAQSKSLT